MSAPRPTCLPAVLLFVFLSPHRGHADVINVPADFPTIQGAIDDPGTGAGDEIVVAPGTYFEMIDFDGKAITLRSSGGHEVTAINGGGAGITLRCESGEGPDTVLDGFMITGGSGGMRIDSSSPTVINCRFRSNGGGGMSNTSSSPTVTNCIFTDNVGWGMKNIDSSLPVVTNCEFVANHGSGMINESGSDAIVTDCLFSGNTAAAGAGMSNFFASPTVTGCTFVGNTTNDGPHNGGGMHSQFSSPIVTNCVFVGNVADQGGGMYNADHFPAVTNCIFSGNAAASGGGIFNGHFMGGTEATITNCTFSDNFAFLGGGLHNGFGGSAVVANCVFWDNAGGPIFPDDSLSTVSYSNVQGGWSGPGSNNFTGDPLFVDPDGADDVAGTVDDDLRVHFASPNIDAGDNGAVPGGVTTDLDGNPRFADVECRADTGNGTAPIVDLGAFEHDGTIGLIASTLHVDAAALGLDDGSTWAQAIPDLQVALAYAGCSGGAAEAIWVAEGTYHPTSDGNNPTATFQLVSGTAIYGGFPTGGGDGTFAARDPDAFPTVLSGDVLGNDPARSDNSYRVVTGSGTVPAAVLDGFTITAGNAGGPAPYRDGAGIYNDGGSPTVANCILEDNHASISGGAMFNTNGSSPIVTSCIFTDNEAILGAGMHNTNGSSPIVTSCTFSGSHDDSDYGGAIYNESSSNPVVANCSFHDNTVLVSGGAIYSIASSPTVINSSFSGNDAGFGGAIYNDLGSSMTLDNCVLWANVASGAGNEIVNDFGGTATIRFSDIEGSGGSGGGWDAAMGIDGGGNIDADPLFVNAGAGDLRLSAGSPAIDAGHSYLVPADAADLDGDDDIAELTPLDLDGNPRFADDPATADTGFGVQAVVDMGAYELPGVPATNPVVLGDIDGDRIVGTSDLLALLAGWGPCGGGFCAADLDADGTVGTADLLLLLANWG